MVVIDTATSGFDTLLGIYTGTAVDALTVVASNDDVSTLVLTSRVRFLATSGTVYRIRVDGYAGATGTINLQVHQAAAPANDDFANAVVLSTQNASRLGDTNDGATLEAGEADTVAGADAGASVWYRWTAPVTGRVTIDTASSTFDTLLGVYTGTAVNALTEVVSNDDVKFPPTSLVRFSATSGITYRIRVDGFAQATGTIDVHLHEVLPAASPANDDFANAVALSSIMSTSASGTNAGATLEAGEAALVAGVPAGRSVWYSWIAPVSGTVTIDTATSGFDTLLGVYTGPAVNALAEIASNDDVGTTDLTSSVRFQATIGTKYLIRVDGYSGDTGAITLHLNENLPPANDNFANAYILSGPNDSRLNDTNVAATLQTGAGEASTVAGQSASGSVWYYWTAPQSTAVTIDTATSDFDTLLGVYTGSAVNTLAEVASNDNVGLGDNTSKVAFPVVAGTVYRIRVDGHLGDSGGTIKLHVALATVSDVPTNVTATPGSEQVTVSWSAPTSDGGSPITGYDVTRYVAGQAPVTTSVGAVTTTTIVGLTNGTTYTFRVAAKNLIGTGPLSANSNPATPRTLPDAPTSVSATAGPGQAIVSWTAPVANGGSPIIGYDVTRYVAGVSQGVTSVGAVTQATVAGLTNGTTYTFRVAAKNAAGAGPQSTDSNAVTPRTVPGAPTSVAAAGGAGQATVSWSAPLSDGTSAITGYEVTPYVAGVAQVATSVGVGTTTTVGGLTNGTTYTFRVAAKNVIGTGAQSTDSNAVTPKAVPAVPTNVTATLGVGQATVNWIAPVSDGGSAITGYDVTRYVGGVAYGTTSVGVVTQATVSGLTNGTTYTFRVAAKNAAGIGAKSADSNPVTIDATRLTLTVTKSGTGAGTVTSSVGGINCGAICAVDFGQGTSVMLTAVASGGSTFAGWSGACAGMTSCIVTIDAVKTATARFDQADQQQQQPPGRRCVVPNVKRKPLATAKRRIAAAHCRTGTVTKASSKTVPKGSVISQKPPAGKKLAAGSKVRLVVSRGKR
jgi:titin